MKVLYYHLLGIRLKQACRNKSTALLPKLTVLINTFQTECIISFIIFISLTPSLRQFENTEESTAAHSVLLSTRTCREATNSDGPSAALSAFCHQSAAANVRLDRNKGGVLSTLSGQEVVCFLFCLLSSRQTADLLHPYVSCEARRAAVASPQSVALEASSAPLQCYATRVWPRPVWVGCLVERSRCTHTRCHWGSVEILRQKRHNKIHKTIMTGFIP